VQFVGLFFVFIIENARSKKQNSIFSLWGHPHGITSPSYIQSAAFPHNSPSSVCTPILADNPDNGRLTVMVALSRSLCLADKMALLNVSTIKNHAVSHALRLGQLTNGRPG